MRDAFTSPEINNNSSSVYILVGSSLLTNFLFAGIIFGWPLLQLLFEEEGILRPESCSSDSGSICYEQKNRIMELYTIAATIQAMFTMPGGYMVDILGPRKCISLAMIMVRFRYYLYIYIYIMHAFAYDIFLQLIIIGITVIISCIYTHFLNR